MKDFKILKFLDKLAPLFRKTGINYMLMRKILQVKLTMDNRRELTVFQNNNKKKEPDNNNNNNNNDMNFIKSLWVYLLMGIILIPFIIMKQNYIYQMSIVFGIIMFFIMTSLISDFSSVLLDIKDINILGTKPIDAKTIRLAKTIHISIYIFYITITLTGPALILSFVIQGPIFFITFLILTVLMDLFCIVLTSFVYLFILRFFDGEKLKDIINYIQILLSIVIMVGYQLISRLFVIIDFKIEFIPKWWQYFIIPIWFAAPFQIIKKLEVNNTYILFTIMSIVIPIVAILVYIKLMPLFEKSIQKLSNNVESHKRVKIKSVRSLADILCHNREEKIFFRFASDMMKNEREFKLKVYPSLGFSLVFPFIFIIQRLFETSFHEVSKGNTYFFIYFCGLMLPSLIEMMKYSANFKGAWIYKALPIEKVAPIFKGTIKAFLTRIFIPLFLLEAIIFIAIYGTRIIPHMFIVFINLLIFNTICFMAYKKSFPFSESFQTARQENFMVGLLLFGLLAGMGGLHYLCTTFHYGFYIYLVLSLIVNFILWKFAFPISRDKLNLTK